MIDIDTLISIFRQLCDKLREGAFQITGRTKNGQPLRRRRRRSRRARLKAYVTSVLLTCFEVVSERLAPLFARSKPSHSARRRQGTRVIAYDPGNAHRRHMQRLAISGVLALVFVFSLWQIGSYVWDYFASRRASAALRETYYQSLAEESPTPQPPAVTPTPQPAQETSADVAPTPTSTPNLYLETVRYPNNPTAEVRSSFRDIRRQNSDIIGWLTIDGMLDEAVVQRDNSYYLRRDYKGLHNVNGAIFLDEGCNLKLRPYTFMLYGHNMKTGEMFGSLRNFENLSYYKNNPFITFDTAYEEGRFVIFAVGTASLESDERNFIDFFKLTSLNIAWREEAIAKLKRISVFTTEIDVDADDQLLLLITCVDDDDERRVVAARRLRENETEYRLKQHVRNSWPQ